jgi:DNA polymerase (family 10)
MAERTVRNAEIVAHLREIADMLEANGENPFRVKSYRTAAASVEQAAGSVAALARKNGAEGLRELSGIGERIAGLIDEYVRTGTTELRETLEKEVPQERRAAARAQASKHEFPVPVKIPVDQILAIDTEYREKAKAGVLKKIAPRLQNPDKEAWLPVMTRESKGVIFTVMFSNTATAHELGKTDDWVVVYSAKGKGEDQCTVVTEHRGTLKGKRVIRGREKECADYYAG